MQKVYNNLPIFLQNIICSLYGQKIKKQRFGEYFFKTLQWLEDSQWWSENDIDNYQNEQIKKLVEYAYKKVPYYKELFHENKLQPEDIRTKEDLYKIPLLTKELFRNNWKKIISSDYKIRDLIHTHTSGSTGKALDFYLSSKALQFQWAVWWRFRERFKVQFGDLHCNFTGKIAVPIQQMKPPYWRYNKPINQYHINMHHVTPNKINSIVEFLNSKKFIYYAGYPSILYQLCLIMEENDLHITHPPKVVFTGAENLLDEQIEKIGSILHCKVTDQYGFAEGCGNSSKCERDLYHEDFEFGILECVEGDNTIKFMNQRTGKVVGTGFANYAMPFIRYDVGDVGTWIDTKCPCGRLSRTMKYIDGRNEDYIITPEGRKIRRIGYIFQATRNVKEVQLVQKKQGEVIVKIVKRDEYSIKDEKAIQKGIAHWLSPKLKIDFLYVSNIDREPSGKLKIVKTLLHKNNPDQ